MEVQKTDTKKNPLRGQKNVSVSGFSAPLQGILLRF